MKITDSTLTKFIGLDEQSEIPIFQRRYEWKEENVIKLIDDILRISTSICPCHFIGSIMYKNDESEDGVEKRTIIDGQQRLTTISLLLLALEDYSKETNPNDKKTLKQITRYQYNDVDEESTLVFKIKHDGDDMASYNDLLTNRNDAIINHPDNACIKNYQIILKELKRRKRDAIDYVKGIEKLRIVDILVEKEDDAQSIFETVNTTGLDLTSTEIIKNYILMTVPANHQLNLFTSKWYPMEQYFHSAKAKNGEFELFFKYFLRAVTKKEIDENKFYKNFKEYVENDPLKRGTEKIVGNDLVPYYENYLNWKSSDNYSRDKIARALYYIKLSKNDIVLPVVLKILENIRRAESKVKVASEEEKSNCKEYLNQVKENAVSILNLIDAYLTRRTLCGYESKSLGKVWLKMIQRIDDSLTLEEFNKFFDDVKDSEQKMPNDNSIIEAAKSVQIYSKIKWLNCTLSRIENYYQNDTPPQYHGIWTIEHIMPQTIYSKEELDNMNLSEEEKSKLSWQKDLGDNWKYIHEKYLHTLGNLTLLGYKNNSAVQNYSFVVKRDMVNNDKLKNCGYSLSSIKITSDLKKYQQWTETEILLRAKEMADTVIQIWPYYKKDDSDVI